MKGLLRAKYDQKYKNLFFIKTQVQGFLCSLLIRHNLWSENDKCLLSLSYRICFGRIALFSFAINSHLMGVLHQSRGNRIIVVMDISSIKLSEAVFAVPGICSRKWSHVTLLASHFKCSNEIKVSSGCDRCKALVSKSTEWIQPALVSGIHVQIIAFASCYPHPLAKFNGNPSIHKDWETSEDNTESNLIADQMVELIGFKFSCQWPLRTNPLPVKFHIPPQKDS